MIVCSCNVITDHDVRGALADGAACVRQVGEVYKCLGCSPCCGRCARTILAIMREAGAASCGTCAAGEAEVASIETGAGAATLVVAHAHATVFDAHGVTEIDGAVVLLAAE